MSDKTTEVWYRNPTLYVREAVEQRAPNLIFMLAHARKQKIDPVKYVQMNYGNIPWRILVVENSSERVETREYDAEHGEEVIAKWPIWEYGNSPTLLKKNLAWAEEHVGRVIIDRVPKLSSSIAQQFVLSMGKLQTAHPNATIHLHGLYSYGWAFGSGVGAADIDPKAMAKYGKVHLPNGALSEWDDDKIQEMKYWITLCGFKPSDLSVPRNRCMFNIASARWAGENFQRNINWSVKSTHERDDDGDVIVVERTSFFFSWKKKPEDGDYLACDKCTLSDQCRYYRARSVCSVPGTSGDELGKKFQTRDVDTILDGLGELLATQTGRLQSALNKEEDADHIDPNVTKLVESTFDRAKELAKLIDPARFSVSSSSASGVTALPSDASAASLMKAIIERLTELGVPRNKITPAMVEEILAAPQSRQTKAIEAAAKEALASP